MLSLAGESWTWYSVVILVVIFRYISRYLHLRSIKRFQPEDWLMLFVVAIYTVLVTFMNIVAFVDTNLMLAEDVPKLTAESIQSRIYGSKLVLLVEQCMITAQWGCKICLLLIYDKLTMGLNQRWAVKAVGGYVVLGLLVMEILYFGVWCRPFNQYWAVPVENIQCSAAINHLIVNATFNISSDIMMLCIPLPLLISSQLPVLKKIILCGLFGLGIFVILCATLNKYYSFTQPFSPAWTFWYIREASTAILVANIPNCWPLLRRIFNLRSFSGSSDNPTTGNGGIAGRNNNMSASRTGGIILGHHPTGVKISSTDESAAFSSSKRGRTLAKSESLEYINGGDESGSASDVGSRAGERGHVGKDVPLEIWQDVEVSIQKFDADSERPGSTRRDTFRDGHKQWDIEGKGDLSEVRRGKTKTVVTAQGASVP